MNEDDILNKVRGNWINTHMIHIESQTTNGIPDLNFIHQGTEVWMELKVLRDEHIYMEMFQPQWHLNRNMRGGRCIIFAANRDTIKILRITRPEQAVKGEEVGKFRKFKVADLDEIATWERPFRWPVMFEELMEKIG